MMRVGENVIAKQKSLADHQLNRYRVNLTLPYINSEIVIPAPYQVRDRLQSNSD
jgi:hypothetical protein